MKVILWKSQLNLSIEWSKCLYNNEMLKILTTNDTRIMQFTVTVNLFNSRWRMVRNPAKKHHLTDGLLRKLSMQNVIVKHLKTYFEQLDDIECRGGYFQQDGAITQTARVSMELMKWVFEDKLILKGLWPPRSRFLPVGLFNTVDICQ